MKIGAAMSRARKTTVKKKAGRARAVSKQKARSAQPKEKAAAGAVGAKLSEVEQDLMWHMEHGYALETDSLGGDPVLRRLANDEVVRPASANRNTVKALEDRGLIAQSSNPLTIVWRLNKKS